MAAKYDNTDGRLRGRALQARRLRKWSQACGACAKCGQLTNWPDGFHLDHIAMLEKSKDDTEENTQVLCIECHDRKTMLDMGFAERLDFDSAGRVKW